MTDDLVLRAVSLYALKKAFGDRYEQARAELSAHMAKATTLPGRSPLDDTKIGTISKSDPGKEAVITDEAAFTEWVRKHYPDDVKPEFEIIGSDEEVKGVLFDHARELLRSVSIIDPDVVKRIRRASVAAGRPVGPDGEVDVAGLEVRAGEGVARCNLADGAIDAVLDLIRAEQLSLDAMAYPEIERGTDGRDDA